MVPRNRLHALLSAFKILRIRAPLRKFMVMQSVCTYFGIEASHKLQWAHAVNHRSLLNTVADNPSIHMAEADVCYADADALPVLAHPWQDIADLDILTFLDTLNTVGKGAKLDFTSATAVEPTLQLLQRLNADNRLSVPVMLHANVFSLLPDSTGTLSSTTEGLEPEQFIRLCQSYCPQAVLSLGWSLRREYDRDGRVEDVLIQQMADLIQRRLGHHNYTIEIRGGYTAGWERGAALIFDPLPAVPAPSVAVGGNVVNLSARRAA